MLDVRLLGKFEVLLDGVSVEIPSRPAQSLFAYLILNPGVNHRREKLAGLLWPDSDENNARSNLRHALWRLRKAVGDQYFDSDKLNIAFIAGSEYVLDVDQLLGELDASVDCEARIEQISAYEGDLLPGFYDQWVTQERERVHVRFENCMQLLLDHLSTEKRWPEVREWGEYWIAHGQSPEPAFRAVMSAYAGLDDLAGVAATYQRCTGALRDNLGVEPSRETRELYARLSRDEATEPVIAERPPHNLPTPATPFLGREQELAIITEQLANEDCRLLTLTGPGGIGKTRLALEIAGHALDHNVHGIYFVPFAAVPSTDFVISAIAEAIRFELSGGDDPQKQLLHYLHDKEMLLIMDNFEHLLDGAKLLADIIAVSSKTKIVVTSRSRLNLHGEWLLEVDSLPIPNLGETENLERYAIVQLFLQTARRINTSFELKDTDYPHLVRICRLVGGMPLAVELAASWVRMLSCDEIAAEIERSFDFLAVPLRDVPERHHSLGAVFNSSWELLDDTEREIVMKLSVFRGGFMREAAEQVVNTSLPFLSALVDKSFLQVSERGRYHCHELIRQYASHRLRESPQEEEAVTNLHSATYLDFLTSQEGALRGGQRLGALSAIGDEIDNIRAAWSWAVDNRMADQLQQATDALWLYYDIRSWFKEGFEAFGAASGALRDRDNELHLFQALTMLQARQAWFGWRLGRYQDAEAMAGDSLQRAQGYDLQYEIAFCQNLLGMVAYAQGSYAQAQDYCNNSLSLWRELGNQWGKAISLFNLGQIAYALGEYGEAEEPYREGLEIFHEIGYQSGSTFSFDSLGRVASALGEYLEARDLCLESLALRREIEDPWGVAACLDSLGAVLCGLGRYEEAKEACLESLTIRKELGGSRGIATAYNNLAHVYAYLGDYRQARTNCEEGLLIRRELGDRRGIAASLNLLSNIAIQLEVFPAAKHYSLESLAIRKDLGDRRGIAASLNILGSITVILEEFEEAEDYFRESLAIGHEIGATPQSLEALVGLSVCFIERDVVELASELLALVTIHASSPEMVRDRAAGLLEDLLARFPTEKIQQAQERGTAKTLEALITEILDELF